MNEQFRGMFLIAYQIGRRLSTQDAWRIHSSVKVPLCSYRSC
jgi:hypothetical protein